MQRGRVFVKLVHPEEQQSAPPTQKIVYPLPTTPSQKQIVTVSHLIADITQYARISGLVGRRLFLVDSALIPTLQSGSFNSSYSSSYLIENGAVFECLAESRWADLIRDRDHLILELSLLNTSSSDTIPLETSVGQSLKGDGIMGFNDGPFISSTVPSNNKRKLDHSSSSSSSSDSDSDSSMIESDTSSSDSSSDSSDSSSSSSSSDSSDSSSSDSSSDSAPEELPIQKQSIDNSTAICIQNTPNQSTQIATPTLHSTLRNLIDSTPPLPNPQDSTLQTHVTVTSIFQPPHLFEGRRLPRKNGSLIPTTLRRTRIETGTAAHKNGNGDGDAMGVEIEWYEGGQVVHMPNINLAMMPPLKRKKMRKRGSMAANSSSSQRAHLHFSQEEMGDELGDDLDTQSQQVHSTNESIDYDGTIQSSQPFHPNNQPSKIIRITECVPLQHSKQLKSGDMITYRELELGTDFTPQLSQFKCALVESIDIESVTLSRLDGNIKIIGDNDQSTIENNVPMRRKPLPREILKQMNSDEEEDYNQSEQKELSTLYEIHLLPSTSSKYHY